MACIIRRRERKDCGDIARVVTESWQDAYRGIIADDVLDGLPASEGERARKALECFDDNDNHQLVLEADGEIAGFVSVGITDDPEFPGQGEVFALYLRKEVQGNGYGRKLMEAGMEELQRMGCGRIFVGCLDGNPSNGFYIHLGGRKVKTRLYHGELPENVYEMEGKKGTGMTELRKLSAEDGRDIYDMLQTMPKDENGLINNVYGMTFEEYREWLTRKVAESEQEGLVDGWKVPSTTYWLYVDGTPVGFGNVRSFLTEALKKQGGNIGYGIAPAYRGRGYGKELLRLLLRKANETGIGKALMTIHADNIPSRKVALANGGVITEETEERIWVWIDTKEQLDNQALVDFWSEALDLSEEDREELGKCGAEDWKELAFSEKLLDAAASLGNRKKVLDYGCGNGWASIIAAKSGCPDVTAADMAPGAVRSAAAYVEAFGAGTQVHAQCIGADWLQGVPDGAYDGVFCSNVLDVVPPETAEGILKELARAVAGDASVIIGLNFRLDPETAKARGQELVNGNMLYVDGVLRLVTRTDEEWAGIFAPYFTVEKLEHFAWPGEPAETRRLFFLRKKA